MTGYAAGLSQGRVSGDWTESAPLVLTRSILRESRLPEAVDLRPCLGPSAALDAAGIGGGLRECRIENLLFLDLETTGLSGGAGTMAFLAALARVTAGSEGRKLEIRQFFLEDYPGEGAFLDAFVPLLVQGTVIASFNGRSFDEPILRTRCVLNRRSFPRLLHVDFLHAARRLWRKRFPDCSLGTLERGLLGRSREADVPGSRIPEVWFSYSRSGFHPLIDAVIEHNAADVEALAGVAAACFRTHIDPERAEDCDLTALGSLWLRLDEGKGVRTLERAFARGDEKAGWALLKHYRRAGMLIDYERILGALPPSAEVLLEMSRHAERRRGDVSASHSLALQALSRASDPGLRAQLARRIQRLSGRMAAKASRRGRIDRKT